MSDTIEFDATVSKVSTLIDQGLRFTFDAPETAIVAAAQLMAMKREGVVLHVIIEPEKQVKAGNEQGTMGTRAIRKSSRSGA